MNYALFEIDFGYLIITLKDKKVRGRIFSTTDCSTVQLAALVSAVIHVSGFRK